MPEGAFQQLKASMHPLGPHPFLTGHNVQDGDHLDAGLMITGPLEMQQKDVRLTLMWADVVILHKW